MLKVLSVRECDADYEISFINLNSSDIFDIYLPKMFFKPLILDGEVVEEGHMIEEGEVYTCSFNTFKDNYNEDVYCYSIKCGKKNFNLHYDEPFEELL